MRAFSVPGWIQEDQKIRAERIVVDGGGPAGTCACVLGRSGLKTGIMTILWNPQGLTERKLALSPLILSIRLAQAARGNGILTSCDCV